ncbi:MAG: hypothetical protein ABIN36_06110 [Ferruginibacter sp.]
MKKQLPWNEVTKGTGYGMPDAGYEMRKNLLRIPDAGYGTRNAGCGIPDNGDERFGLNECWVN